MKIILEFDGEDHFEELAAKRAMNATNAYLVIHEVIQKLREKVKWPKEGEDVAKYEEILELVCAAMERMGITLDDLP